MSHVVSINTFKIKDLNLLERAAVKNGWTLNKGAKTFTYWSGNKQDCDHSLSFPRETYQVGLIANSAGGFDLKLDSMVQTKFGKKISDAYTTEVALETAKRLGGKLHTSVNKSTNELVLTIDVN